MNSFSVVEKLYTSLLASSKRLTGLREPRTIDVFERRSTIWPQDIVVPELGDRNPYAAFNPGAVLDGGYVEVFPRLITGYFWYTSVIGYFRVRLSELLEGVYEKPVRAKIVIHPSNRLDLAGCEDPRVDKIEDKYYVLYTALEPLADRVHAVNAVSRQGLAILSNDLVVEEKHVIRIIDRSGSAIELPEVKDAALLHGGERLSILIRPDIRGVKACWSAPLRGYNVAAEEMKPLLLPEPWEHKVGCSTNAVEIGKREYLVAWHGVGLDMVYRTGFAVVSDEGELLAITRHYLLEPRTVQEYSGERPGVVFGCGLLRKGDMLVFVGGVADTAIGVYTAELDKVLEHMVWLNKR